MRRLTVGLLAMALAVTAPLAQAGEAQARLFAADALTDVAPGVRLVYRQVQAGRLVTPPREGQITLAIDGSVPDRRAVHLTLVGPQGTRRLDPLPATGNPVLLVFMEETVRLVAAASGGSPFYIRARLRDALRSQDETHPMSAAVDGGEVAGLNLAFRPLLQDPNATRMQGLAGLELNFVLSPAVPGGFVSMEAVARDPQGGMLLRHGLDFERAEAG